MHRLRATVLTDYIEIAGEVGVNPQPLIRVAGIDPAAFVDGTGWMPAVAVDRLLMMTAEQAGRPDFAVRLSAGRGIANLGAVGLVAREEPDVRSAMGIILRHINLHNEAVELSLAESSGMATLLVEPADGLELGTQSIELAVGSVFRMLADFLPQDWRPAAVCFRHPEPEDPQAYIELLGGNVLFGHAINGVAMASGDLDRPNPLANPLLRPFAHEYLRWLAPAGATGPEVQVQVRDLIGALLASGCSATRVARGLGMDRRTLHRRLAATGTSYSAVLDSVREERARQAIGRRDRTLTDIAVELGFSELSAFSRWFRERFGVGPREWARQARDE